MTSKIRTLADLHSKVFIFDERAALVGSTNMSASSLDQYQLGLEVCDAAIVRQLIAWFAELWARASPVDLKMVRRLIPLWPSHEFFVPGHRKNVTLPRWRSEPPEPAPGPSDFKMKVTKEGLRQLLFEFRNNECKYRDDGASCSKTAKENEVRYNRLGERLHSLWRRRASWGRKELEEIFELAYANGRAAMMIKPEVVRQNPGRVARSIGFLLQGAGDPYVRFEKMLANASPYKLHGLAEVGVICLMHLWEPKEFALIAEPVDKALKSLVDFGRPVSVRKGQGFKDRTAAAKRIAELTGLRTLGRVDHFLDAVGKGHIGRLGKRRPAGEN
jgi:hypothetical protein